MRLLEFEEYIKQTYGIEISIDDLSVHFHYFQKYINDYVLPTLAELED